MTDKQLLKFAAAFREGILDGRSSYLMCAAVSRPLAGLLNYHGLRCEVAESENGAGGHTWIALADGRVLDPTADQYNYPGFKQYPPIYLGAPTELHDPELGYDPAIAAGSGTAETNEDSAQCEASQSGGAAASPEHRSSPSIDEELIERLRRFGYYPADESARGHIGTYIALCNLARDRLESLLSDRAKLEEALRCILEGNLGPEPWQANYARIQEIAGAALNRSTDRG